ncbi:hypothetical protein VCRA2117O37_10515 [Vibrio crassostreae]|nr:hypothetical protein VCRA2116O31_10512 [Vibrio crassostreae]CAK1899752.1 hypothetical protein VCRA2117O37_10515 [Vibrio crassostreae]CAK2339126.1 hypothetical protein VCRA2119O50_20306 [Vibrio crassostreae]CAK2636401.1 hypothetical protein VCRA2113O25_10001 [Vibrio crassostreae]
MAKKKILNGVSISCKKQVSNDQVSVPSNQIQNNKRERKWLYITQ